MARRRSSRCADCRRLYYDPFGVAPLECIECWEATTNQEYGRQWQRERAKHEMIAALPTNLPTKGGWSSW